MVLIKLKIKLIDGNDTTITIDDEKTVTDLRESICVATSILYADQRVIFRGKVLSDNNQKLKECGLEDNMAIHVVQRPSQMTAGNSSSQTQQPSRDHDYARQRPQIVTQNLIIGQVPFERTPLFREPNQALTIVGNAMERLRGQFQMETQHTLLIDRPHNNDFSINVILRGIRQQFLDSPARERFDDLRMELRKLAWLVALIQAQFLDDIDAIIIGQSQIDQREYRTIARVLHAMHTFDHYDEEQLANFVSNHNKDAELWALIDQMNSWRLEDDEDHIQQLSPIVTMRHVTSHDLSTLLMMLSVVDAKINEHLLSRYQQILTLPHNLQASSYPARMLNCFSNAMARVQHYRAHIYHTISDLALHVDQNEHNRIYPQYAGYHRYEEPPQAEISLMFFEPPNVQNTVQTEPPQHSRIQPSPFNFNPNAPPFNPRTPPPQYNQQNSHHQQTTHAHGQGTLNSMLSGFINFAQQMMGGGDGGSLHQQSSHRSPTQQQQGPMMPARNGREANAAPSSNTTSAPSVARPLTPPIPLQPPPQIPPQYRSISAERTGESRRSGPGQPRIPGQTPPSGFQQDLSWGRTSPETPSALFIGPNPPNHFPMYTMDRFLPCPSRRYRVFEADSRHFDFWNDPRTVAFGLQPPENSLTGLERADGPPNQENNMEMDWNVHHRANRRENGLAESIIDPTVQPLANRNGEAVFNEVEQFAQFIRQTFESIANCLAQYDSRLLPHSDRPQRGFTAGSRVAGYIPFIPIPVPYHGLPNNAPGVLIGQPYETVLSLSISRPGQQSQQPTADGNGGNRNNNSA